MISIPDQEDRLAVQDLHDAPAKLRREQREALVLVGWRGFRMRKLPRRSG